ncbi:MAG: hypothetical protein K2X66_14905 [Cyanobacteria bacterium]|nr:hypothetical protein [Cyanobacteriota bacterium]
MSLQEQFNPEHIAHELTTEFYQRMVSLHLPDEEIQSTANVLFEFGKIAGSLILDEGGIESPSTNQTIPYDMSMATQSMKLFCEGLYHTALKCYEMRLPNELKSGLMQQVAQDLFSQTKQMVLTTYGQESTPEYQITMDQQVLMICQTVDSAMTYLLAEYEKQNGPLLGTLPQRSLLDSALDSAVSQNAPHTPQNLLETQAPQESHLLEVPQSDSLTPHYPGEVHPPTHPPQNLINSQPQPHHLPPPPSTRGPHPHDKYAAVGLLVNTLQNKPEVIYSVLRHFNPEERSLIQFYQDPENIEKNLDLGCVTRHLKSFKTLMKQGNSSLRPKAENAFESLFKNQNKQTVLNLVSQERELILTYLNHYFPKETAENTENNGLFPLSAAQRHNAISAQAPPKGLPFKEILPPKIEELLFKYLSAKLSTETVTSLKPEGASR